MFVDFAEKKWENCVWEFMKGIKISYSKKNLEALSNKALDELSKKISEEILIIKRFLKNFVKNSKEYIAKRSKLKREINALNTLFKKNAKVTEVNEGIVFSDKKKDIYFKSNLEKYLKKLKEVCKSNKEIINFYEKEFMIFRHSEDPAIERYPIADMPVKHEIEHVGPDSIFPHIAVAFSEKNYTKRTNELFATIGKIFWDNTDYPDILETHIKQLPKKKFYEEEQLLEIEEKNNILRRIELILRARKTGKEKMENVGYVYVLSNKSLPSNTYKIGSTYGLPEIRAEELTGTGHITPFKVIDKIKIQSAEYYEKTIHRILKRYRVKKEREFFKLEINKIKNCLKQVSILSESGKKKVSYSTLKNKIKI